MKVHVPTIRNTSRLSDSKLAELTPQEFQEYARNRLSYLNRKTNAAERRRQIAKQKLTAATQARDDKIERKTAIAEIPYLLREEEEERHKQERQEKEEEERQERLDAQHSSAHLNESRTIAKERQNIQDRINTVLGMQVTYILDMAEPSYLNKDEMIIRLPATEIYKDMLDKKFTDEKNKIIGDRSLYDTGVLDEVEERFKKFLDSEFENNKDYYINEYDKITRAESVRISNKRVSDQTARHLGRGGSQ